ncbi:hypothetical protein D6D23_07965 [Aureobasidium pullulans]|nr:hypothetical protein D6D23_07965 [Aureobasidium pullulans]
MNVKPYFVLEDWISPVQLFSSNAFIVKSNVQLLKHALDIASALAGEGSLRMTDGPGKALDGPTEEKRKKMMRKPKKKKKRSRDEPYKAKKVTLDVSYESESSSDSDSEEEQGKEKASEDEKEDVAIPDALFKTPKTAQQEMRPRPRRAL